MTQTFPLAAVVRLRQQTMTALERVLAHADAEVRRANQTVAELELKMQSHREERRKEIGLLLTTAHHHVVAAGWAALRRQLLDQQNLLADLKTSRLKALETLLQARRQLETVENLEMNWHTSRQSKQDKKEQLQLDDLSAARSQRENTANSADQPGQDLPGLSRGSEKS